MQLRSQTSPQLQQRGDLRGSNDELLGTVLSGLYRRPKRLPSKLLYDTEGSKLFEQICKTPEYYPTRTELSILRRNSADIARTLGPNVMLVEYGSGSGIKTHLLLRQLDEPAAYMPVDISQSALLDSVAQLRASFPDLTILPLCADFTQPFGTLPPLSSAQRRVVFFPGSTIGNFEDHEAVRLLRRMRLQMGEKGGALIGFDLKKDPDIIEAAYNDAQGLTARFTLNLLERFNRELHANFDLDNFVHRATYNRVLGRIETHIICLHEQHVRVGDEIIRFGQGEAMLVEISCKYSAADFGELAARAELRVERSWSDPDGLFCMQYLVPEGS